MCVSVSAVTLQGRQPLTAASLIDSVWVGGNWPRGQSDVGQTEACWEAAAQPGPLADDSSLALSLLVCLLCSSAGRAVDGGATEQVVGE